MTGQVPHLPLELRLALQQLVEAATLQRCLLDLADHLPELGEPLLQALVLGEDPPFDPAPFDPARFDPARFGRL